MFNSTFRTTARFLIILVGSSGIAGAASITSFCTPSVGSGTVAVIAGGNGSASMSCMGVTAPVGSMIGRITLTLNADYLFGSASGTSVNVTLDASSVNAPFTKTVTVTGGTASSNSPQDFIQFSPPGGLTSVGAFSVLVTSAVTTGTVAASSAVVGVIYCLNEPACAIAPTNATPGNWTLVGPTGSWFDPPFTSSYDYTGTGGTTFTGLVWRTVLGRSTSSMDPASAPRWAPSRAVRRWILSPSPESRSVPSASAASIPP